MDRGIDDRLEGTATETETEAATDTLHPVRNITVGKNARTNLLFFQCPSLSAFFASTPSSCPRSLRDACAPGARSSAWCCWQRQEPVWDTIRMRAVKVCLSLLLSVRSERLIRVSLTRQGQVHGHGRHRAGMLTHVVELFHPPTDTLLFLTSLRTFTRCFDVCGSKPYSPLYVPTIGLSMDLQ